MRVVPAAHCAMAPLLAGALGVASFADLSSAMAGDVREEVVVTAERQSDALLTAKVTEALQSDPYIFSEHVTVTSENGVIRLEGIMSDLQDMFRVLRLARRIAGKGRVVNRIEFVPSDDDGN